MNSVIARSDRYLAEVEFLLNDFAAGTAGVTHVVAVSGDGMLLATTERLPTHAAEQLAAAGSGLVSLLRGAGSILAAGGARQSICHFDAGFLILMEVADPRTGESRASLLVLARPDCDMALVVDAMTLLVDRVGPALTPPART